VASIADPPAVCANDEKQKRARVRRIVSLRALVVVVVERDRSIEIDRHRISAIFRASRARLRARSSLVRMNKGRNARAVVGRRSRRASSLASRARTVST